MIFLILHHAVDFDYVDSSLIVILSHYYFVEKDFSKLLPRCKNFQRHLDVFILSLISKVYVRLVVYM